MAQFSGQTSNPKMISYGEAPLVSLRAVRIDHKIDGSVAIQSVTWRVASSDLMRVDTLLAGESRASLISERSWECRWALSFFLWCENVATQVPSESCLQDVFLLAEFWIHFSFEFNVQSLRKIWSGVSSTRRLVLDFDVKAGAKVVHGAAYERRMVVHNYGVWYTKAAADV